MADVVIRAERLGKKYSIAHQRQAARYVALREEIGRAAKAFWRRARDMARGGQLLDGEEIEEFWALRGVDFEIRRGEVVGVIGRNGAGKSTLLKVLSRITEPSEGRVVIEGRIASLLEVGTGFHPELTGRDNIFLNGAILGMGRAEIRRKFDEIVAFADIERFLDTPVKRYSSGMSVRLAFAVAAHLEPEILVVDEVLAVGDAEFQKKCLGKMSEVAHGGRTVFFVSHNMSAVQSLCGRGMLLDHGRLVADGSVSDVIQGYVAALENASREAGALEASLGPGLVLRRLAFGEGGVRSGEDAQFRIELVSSEPIVLTEACLLIHSELGMRVAIVDLRNAGVRNVRVEERGLTISGRVKSLALVEGRYRIGMWVMTQFGGFEHSDLVVLSALPGVADANREVYPAMYRGFVELEFSAEIDQGAADEAAGARSSVV
jgi:ABC-type polysaccharide/polyol phosphate transport system ATPase subunit